MPGFIEPCDPRQENAVPSGKNWIHEIKFDGYRVQAHVTGARRTLFTRNGYDWTLKFSRIAEELSLLSIRSVILDGEVTVADARGRPDFHLLQADVAQARSDRMTYCIFDVLYLNGRDLRPCELRYRREALRTLLSVRFERLMFSEAIDAAPAALLEHACKMDLEGVVSKALDSPYRSGRQSAWIKVKCKNTGTYPIVAFVEKLGASPRRIASLYLGRYEKGQLLYAGKAETGFATEDLYDLRERLDPYISKTSPLSVPVKKPKATWVRPEVLAEVQFTSFTADGLLRFPVYKGVRDDLTSAGTQRSAPASPPATRARSRGVPPSNILQLLPEAVSPSPEQLVEYWSRVHERALPYLARRPLKLVRRVGTKTFYHKGRLPPRPGAVKELTVRKREGGEGIRVWVDDLDGLLGLIEMDVVEVHPWNGTVDDVELADTMVFDLDPGPGVRWRFVIDAALTLRELLAQEGYDDSWPKLTGGKGIHVMVPLRTPVTHDAAHHTSRRIAERRTETDSERFTVSSAFAARRGRLFVDFLRNGRGTTAVGTFSPRARPNFPVAAPTDWASVERGIWPDAFNMDSFGAVAQAARRWRGPKR